MDQFSPSQDNHRVVVGSNMSGNSGGHSRLPDWLRRVRSSLVSNWRYQAVAAVIVLVGSGAVVFAFLVLRPPSQPLSVATEQTPEGIKIDTDGDGTPDTVVTENGSVQPDGTQATNGGGGSSSSSSSPSGGNGGSSSSSGGNTGGNAGNEPPPGGGEPPSSCALPKYPTAGCTGVPSVISTNLAADNRCTLSTAGEVITGKQFSCRLNVTANNVTIKNSYLAKGIDNYGGGGSFTIEDSTVGPSSGCDSGLTFGIGARKYTARRVLVRGIPDGFRVSNLSGSETVTIEDSYYYSCANPGDHSDGVQVDGNSGNATIRHNTLDLAGSESSTSPVFWADFSENSHGTITDNLLIGGSYVIWLGTGNGHIVTGNRLVIANAYGPNNSNCATVSSWQDNRLATVDGGYGITSTGGVVTCS